MNKSAQDNKREAFVLEAASKCKLNETSFRDPVDAEVCRRHIAAGLLQLDTEFGMLVVTTKGMVALQEASVKAVADVVVSTSTTIANFLKEYS